MLYHPAIAIGRTSKCASPWKGTHIIEKFLNDVTIRNKKEKSKKQQIVQYDSLKLFFETPPTSNVPTRNKRRTFQLTQDRADTRKHIDGALSHDDCLSFLPAPSSIFTPIPTERRPTASISTSKLKPNNSSALIRREVTRSPPVFSQTPTLERHSPHARNDFAIQSPNTPPIDIPALIPGNAFLLERQSPRDNVTEIVDAAARNLRRTPHSSTSKMQLQLNTSSQGKTQPLLTSYLPDILTDYNSPEEKVSKQSDAKRIKSSAQKRKSSHQKKHRSAFRITTAFYVWRKFFTAHIVQYSTVNKQQLPAFGCGAVVIFKYKIVKSVSESLVRLLSPSPTLADVNIKGVHAFLRVSNQQLSRMQSRLGHVGFNNLTFLRITYTSYTING